MGVIVVAYEILAIYEGPLQGVRLNYTGWTKEKVLDTYNDVFENRLGHLSGEVSLRLDTTVRPAQLPARKVPIAIKDQLGEELRKLQEMGVICQVDEPTAAEWVSSLVVARKSNGNLGICIDPKPLNKALMRSHYPLPVVEDILPKVAKAKVFSVCDVRNGFWHVP